MPIRFAFALMQVAVYAMGSAPAVSEYRKPDELCTNFRWVYFQNGTVEILHCDDKPAEQQQGTAAARQKRLPDSSNHPEIARKADSVAEPSGESLPRQDALLTEKEQQLSASRAEPVELKL